MKITDEMMENLARLARLQFKDDEKQELKGDLEKMIEFVNKLNDIDTAGVEPVLHMTETMNVLRSDEIANTVTPQQGLLNAPNKEGRFFKVPKVIKKDN